MFRGPLERHRRRVGSARPGLPEFTRAFEDGGVARLRLQRTGFARRYTNTAVLAGVRIHGDRQQIGTVFLELVDDKEDKEKVIDKEEEMRGNVAPMEKSGE